MRGCGAGVREHAVALVHPRETVRYPLVGAQHRGPAEQLTDFVRLREATNGIAGARRDLDDIERGPGDMIERCDQVADRSAAAGAKVKDLIGRAVVSEVLDVDEVTDRLDLAGGPAHAGAVERDLDLVGLDQFADGVRGSKVLLAPAQVRICADRVEVPQRKRSDRPSGRGIVEDVVCHHLCLGIGARRADHEVLVDTEVVVRDVDRIARAEHDASTAVPLQRLEHLDGFGDVVLVAPQRRSRSTATAPPPTRVDNECCAVHDRGDIQVLREHRVDERRVSSVAAVEDATREKFKPAGVEIIENYRDNASVDTCGGNRAAYVSGTNCNQYLRLSSSCNSGP